MPTKIDIYVSGNILKNVKSVVVPNTNGMRGIKTAVGVGIVAGITELKLECLSKVNSLQIEKTKQFIDETEINIYQSDSNYQFDIKLLLYLNNDIVEARMVDNHTNIVYVKTIM